MDLAPNHCGLRRPSRAALCAVGSICREAGTERLISTRLLTEISTIQKGNKLLCPTHSIFYVFLRDTSLQQLLFKPNQCVLQLFPQFSFDHSVQHTWHNLPPRFLNQPPTGHALACAIRFPGSSGHREFYRNFERQASSYTGKPPTQSEPCSSLQSPDVEQRQTWLDSSPRQDRLMHKNGWKRGN